MGLEKANLGRPRKLKIHWTCHVGPNRTTFGTLLSEKFYNSLPHTEQVFVDFVPQYPFKAIINYVHLIGVLHKLQKRKVPAGDYTEACDHAKRQFEMFPTPTDDGRPMKITPPFTDTVVDLSTEEA